MNIEQMEKYFNDLTHLRNFTGASFIVTEDCNLRCTYCFENSTRCPKNVMTKEVAHKGLEFLFANAKRLKKPVTVILFGGEPLLEPDMCDYIMQTGAEMSKEHQVGFKPSIITNATLMNEKIESLLSKWNDQFEGNFNVQLSIDGDEKSQNLYRVFPDGSGSHKEVMKAVEVYKNIFGKDLCVHGCVNKHTMPYLYENFKFFDELMIPHTHIWYMPVHTEEWTKQDVKIYEEQTKLIFEHNVRKGSFNYAPINKSMGHGNNVLCHPEHTCGAGTSFCSFAWNGDMFPCHNIYFNDLKREELIGNLMTEEFTPEVLHKYHECSPESLGCEKCPNTKCYRCIADNLNVNDDINLPVGKPIRCAMSSVERKYQELANAEVAKYPARYDKRKMKPSNNRLDLNVVLQDHGKRLNDLETVVTAISQLIIDEKPEDEK